MSSSQSHPLPAKPPRSQQDGSQSSFGIRRAPGNAQTSWRSSPTISAGPTSFSHQYSAPSSHPPHQVDPQSYYVQGPQGPYQPSGPQIKNPFVPAVEAAPLAGNQIYNSSTNNGYDAEYAAQVAQWQASYASREDDSKGKGDAGNPNTTALGTNKSRAEVVPVKANPVVEAGQKTVMRSGGGQTWSDASLLEWDPAHFRLFVGNLAGEVTDDSMMKAFSKYTSVQKARVIRDKRTTKSKGYGFVSFSDGDDYFRAAKEMQGKYIGSHPVILRKATTELKATAVKDKNKKDHRGAKNSNSAGGNANTGAGVQKKHPKTRDGMKILG